MIIRRNIVWQNVAWLEHRGVFAFLRAQMGKEKFKKKFHKTICICFTSVSCYWLILLLFTSLSSTRSSPSSSSSSSSSSPDTFGNGPAPCQGASFHPVVWLASCESEAGSGQVLEPAHPAESSSDVWPLTQPWPPASHALPAEAAAHAALQRPEQELLCDTDSPTGQQCDWMHSVSGEYGTGMSGGGGPKAGTTRGEEKSFIMGPYYILVLIFVCCTSCCWHVCFMFSSFIKSLMNVSVISSLFKHIKAR